MVAIPIYDLVLEALEEQGTMRLADLADEIDMDREELYRPVMTQVDRGNLAVFPVGDTVQIRYESGD